MPRKGQKQKRYSAGFKIGVIMDIRKHHLGYCETARKYELGDSNLGGVVHTLRRWERIYLEEGDEDLVKERQDRACSAGETRKERPPKLDKKVEEDLTAKNQRLRMETEYPYYYLTSQKPCCISCIRHIKK